MKLFFISTGGLFWKSLILPRRCPVFSPQPLARWDFERRRFVSDRPGISALSLTRRGEVGVGGQGNVQALVSAERQL